jgi:uncharacterized lipoprotein YddW (UPF0748 family)
MCAVNSSPQGTPVIEVAPPPLAEMRGLRILLPPSPKLAEIQALVGRAAAAGINALVVRVYRRGTTLWPSEAASRWRLPRVRRWHSGRDILAELARACLAEGVALVAWLDLLPAVDHRLERWSPLARRHWAWRMQRFTGSPYPQGVESDQIFLCPARGPVRTFLGDVCTELAERYPVHALWFEGLRYPLGANRPDTSMCHCAVCRSRVHAELEFELAEMPLDERAWEYQAWSRWRQEQLHVLLTEIVARIRRVRGATPITGGVPMGCSAQPAQSVGLMGWARWVREGLLDLACTMDFGSPGATTPAQRLETLRQDLEAVAPAGRLAPLLPLSDLHAPANPLLEAVRTMPLSGLVWDGFPNGLSGEDWSALQRLHGERAALVPEIDPRDSMHSVIGETAELAEKGGPLSTFLADLLSVLQTGYGQFSDAQMGELLEDLAKYQRAAESGDLAVSDRARAVRNLDWLQRQLIYLRGRQLLTRAH